MDPSCSLYLCKCMKIFCNKRGNIKDKPHICFLGEKEQWERQAEAGAHGGGD